MDIRLIEKAGVPASEIDAHQRIQLAFNASAFSKGWRGYASFKLNRGGPGGGDDDYDLILVTHTHVIVIELKNWRGKLLESKGGNWYVDGEPRGRSPVPLVNLKAKKLGSAMQRKLGPAKTPFIYSFVVLGEGISEIELDADEAASVLYVNDLLAWVKAQAYNQAIGRYPRFNPLTFLADYDIFFEGQRGRPPGFTLHGFRPEAKPMWEHPSKLYAEYRAKEKIDPEKLALLRQWDFSAMGAELIGEGERGFIGLREQRVYEYVEPRNEELSRSLLRPVARKAEQDVTRDFAELYVLPPKVMRLSEFVNSVLAKLTSAERVIMVKAILQRFADLHDLNIAHRDIGAHCLWVDRPAKIVISGFPAAYYPAMATVGTFRDKVKVERANLPEDLGLAQESTPYQRDVYSLGVLVHLILFGERPPKANGVFSWAKRARDAHSSAFDVALSKALCLEPRERYENARQMLEAVNAASTNEREQVIELSAFDAHRARTKARDYPEESSPLTDDDDLLSYRSSLDGQQLLVKEWHGVEPDPRRPDFAIRLLSFLERARNLRAAGLAGLPAIFDYGLSRRSLLLIQHWVDGVTLTEWMSNPQTRDARLVVARGLTKTLARLHDFEWPHGDIKPDNIVVQPDGIPVFVDILDYRRNCADFYSTAYLPAGYKTMSPMARDCYSLASVLKELLINGITQDEMLGLERVQEEIHRLLDEQSVSALEPLQSALDGKGQTTSNLNIEPIRITVRNLAMEGISPGEMVSDNGFFHLTMEDSRKLPGAKLIHLTGAGVRLTSEWFGAENRITWLSIKKIDMSQLMWAQEKGLGRIQANLILEDGIRNEASDLVPSLQLWAQEFSEISSTDVIDTSLVVADEDLPMVDSETVDVDVGISLNKKAPVLDVKALWQSLLDAEADTLPMAIVSAEPWRNPQREHQLLLPCVLEGSGFDPDDDDRTWVERQMPDGIWRRCGELELRDTQLGANALLAVERWGGKTPKMGDRLRLRSNMESASLTRRASAVERLLEGRSVIPNLIEYFQTDAIQPVPMEFSGPDDNSLEAYAQGSKSLNESQREAFRKSLQFGPVSLLQGPPGTGKTWFIASLLHYLVTKESARRILVVSQAHEAVNNALEKALELFEGKGIAFDAVRLGRESVVSDPIRHLHSASIEQVYRERFKAEYKERVVRLAMEVGLPKDFAVASVNLHVSLGRLAEQVALLELETPDDGDQGEGETPDSDDSTRPALRRRRLIDTFREISLRDYQFTLNEQPLAAVVDQLFEKLSEQHEIQSPQAIEKLRKLLKLSDDWLKTLGEPAANFVEFLAKSRTIVAGTLVGIGRRAAGVVQNMYDWVIIDEAGRAAPSELAVALQTGRRILLVGDHKQLPPTFSQEVRAAVIAKLGCVDTSQAFASDFERMFDSAYGKKVGVSLREQYRMAPAIGELVSEVFYDGLVATGRAASWLDANLLPRQLKHEVSWIDTSPLGKFALENTSSDHVDSWNVAEAEVVMGVLRSMVQNKDLVLALRNGLHSGEPIIGVICMYSKQRELLNRMKGEARWMPAELRRLIKVDTVDSYQGKENRIVILSTVRNNPKLNPGFLRSPNRINVAMSRAMERLVIVGATSMWRGRNEELPLGRVLRKVEAMVVLNKASVVNAKEFY